MSAENPDGTPPAAAPPATPVPQISVGNMQDVKGILALVTVSGYLGISAAAIFTHTVPDPTPLLTGLGILATAVVMFFFGTKSGANTGQ